MTVVSENVVIFFFF